MKFIKISWQEQVACMQNCASAGGSTDYERVRGEMAAALDYEYRQTNGDRYNISLEYEKIPDKEKAKLIKYIES